MAPPSVLPRIWVGTQSQMYPLQRSKRNVSRLSQSPHPPQHAQNENSATPLSETDETDSPLTCSADCNIVDGSHKRRLVRGQMREGVMLSSLFSESPSISLIYRVIAEVCNLNKPQASFIRVQYSIIRRKRPLCACEEYAIFSMSMSRASNAAYTVADCLTAGRRRVKVR